MPVNEADVARCSDVNTASLSELFSRFNLVIEWIDGDQPIPGSHFGEPEAGLIDNRLYLRPDTPIHSALHESCHYICMGLDRRKNLHTDAGGGYDEENAVCYLSILLADFIEGFNRNIMMYDMDRWGYTFRLGSTRSWFEQDAEDALVWLLNHQVIDKTEKPTWKLCQ
ncbi:MAG: hypothetical protein EP297_07035 [Gammaproteobacteria bacterium]|nr:MAG: hypothetical protein EP297_07035 [Gammaproteobacteria bacterium]